MAWCTRSPVRDIMSERDLVAITRGGQPSGTVPLVSLGDPGYIADRHLPLVDDQERHDLAKLVERERGEEWRSGQISRRDRRQAAALGLLVAAASLTSLGISLLDLLIRAHG